MRHQRRDIHCSLREVQVPQAGQLHALNGKGRLQRRRRRLLTELKSRPLQAAQRAQRFPVLRLEVAAYERDLSQR